MYGEEGGGEGREAGETVLSHVGGPHSPPGSPVPVLHRPLAQELAQGRDPLLFTAASLAPGTSARVTAGALTVFVG